MPSDKELEELIKGKEVYRGYYIIDPSFAVKRISGKKYNADGVLADFNSFNLFDTPGGVMDINVLKKEIDRALVETERMRKLRAIWDKKTANRLNKKKQVGGEMKKYYIKNDNVYRRGEFQDFFVMPKSNIRCSSLSYRDIDEEQTTRKQNFDMLTEREGRRVPIGGAMKKGKGKWDYVDFTGFKGRKNFNKTSHEYKILSEFTPQQWDEYTSDMAAGGVDVEYDSVWNIYVVKGKRRASVSGEISNLTVTKVVVKRAEGPTELCGTWEFKTLVAADKQLWEISRTAPDSGGYDKTDVTVFFSDGQTIKMRHDIKRHDIDGTVAEHIITFSKWVIKNDEKVKNDPAQIADIQKYINALSNKETAPTIPQQKSGGMRNENELMKLWLHKNGVDCTPMFIWTGSMKGTWRLYNKTMKWTPELRDKLTALGFAGSHGPLTQFSGNGGAFSVFVRNPEVTRQLMEITQQAGQSEGKTRYIKRMKGGNLRGRSIGKQVSGWDYSKGEQYLKTTNISALDRSLGFIKTILEGNPDVTETKRAINALKWAEQNPHTRHAFFLITGIKLPKTQKETQALLEKMTGLPSGKQFVTVGKKVGSGISVKGFGNLTNKKLKELKLEIAVMKNGPVRVRTFVDGKLIRLWHEPTTKQAKESLKKYLLGIKNKQRYRIKQILNGEVL